MGADTIAGRVADVRRRIAAACHRAGRPPEGVTIVAVTKGFPPEAIREAVAAGLRHLGENRVQEALAKRRSLAGLPAEVTWHMVGHLQSNKVKTALNLFDIIHSVDSLPLAEAISRRAQKEVPVFLEVNAAGEPTKYGFSLAELPGQYRSIAPLPNLDVRGLMTVAPLVQRPEELRPVFRSVRGAAQALGLGELSMGMTDDFELAVEEGATYVRIGRAIFGERA